MVLPHWLAEAREYVGSSLAEYGEYDFCTIRPTNKKDSPAHRFVSDRNVGAIFERLALTRCPQGVAEDEEIYSVLEFSPARKGKPDRTDFTMTRLSLLCSFRCSFPQPAPEGPESLLCFRTDGLFVALCSLTYSKMVFTQNRFYRKRIMGEFNNAPEKYSVQLKPGNVYLFWGYRTFHGNLPCAPNTVRATLLLHYGNPRGRDPALRCAKYLRRIVAPSSEHTEATVVRL